MKRVFAHIGFSAGLTLLVLNLVQYEYVKPMAAGLAVLFAASLLLSKYRQAVAVPLCFGTALFACLYYMFYCDVCVLPQNVLNGNTVQAMFYLTDIPSFDGEKYTCTAKTVSIALDGAVQNISLKLSSTRPFKEDAYTLLQGNLSLYRPCDSAFVSYGDWGKNIFLHASVNEMFSLGEVSHPLLHRIYLLRTDMVQTLLNRLGKEEGALSVALLLGKKSFLTENTVRAFRFAGASHLMAVSGFHLTVVSGAVLFVFKQLPLGRKVPRVITLCAVAFYVALGGFSKSVVRAGIMMAVLLLAQCFRRHADTLNSLGLAVCLLCLISPFAPTDAGVLLSVLSVLALCTAAPVAEQALLHRQSRLGALQPAVDKILKTVLSTGCILLYTLPVFYLFFGYVSPAGLFSNVVLIPLGSVAIVLSALAFLALKMGWLAALFVAVTRGVLHLLLGFVRYVAGLRFATVALPPYFLIILGGVLIILGFCFIINRKGLKLTALLCVACVAVSLVTVPLYTRQSAVLFLGQSGACALISDECTLVWGVDSRNDYYDILQCLKSDTKVNYLFCTAKEKSVRWSEKLCDKVQCDTFVCPQYPKEYTDKVNANAWIEALTYDIKIENISCRCDIAGESERMHLTVDGVSVAYGDTAADICINNKIIRDGRGEILLKDGDVTYTLGHHSYIARRENAWQS